MLLTQSVLRTSAVELIVERCATVVHSLLRLPNMREMMVNVKYKLTGTEIG